MPSCSLAATSLLMLIAESDSNEHMPILMHTATHTAVPRHCQPDSDSSSNYEYFASHTTHTSLAMSFIPNQLAVVKHVHQSKLLILLAGKIDSVVMHTFELWCLDFFDCKEIKDEDQS